MPALILLIEDDAPSGEVVTFLLKHAGHTVLLATDGATGVHLALTRSPQLILCDLQLPVMDGFAIVRALKANPRWSPAPLIAVTALSMSGDRERVLQQGFDGYLSKPINPQTFVAEIETYLPETAGLRAY